MSVVAGLDALVEPLTAALVRLTGERGPVDEITLEAGPLAITIGGGSDWLAMAIPPAEMLPPALRPWDAQVILLLAMGFDVDDTGMLFLELELDEGVTWEEQPLRELALQVLGIAYYVYEIRDTGSYAIVAE